MSQRCIVDADAFIEWSYKTKQPYLECISRKWDTKINATPSIALVSGNGTDILNNPSLANSSRRKVKTREMVLSLIDVAKKRENRKEYKPIGTRTTA